VVTFAVLAARVWWLSAIVPGMDYPQFLVFVRAAQDYTNASSPFHGTYTLGAWYMPTSLPVQLVALLSHLCGGSLETAGKLLLAADDMTFVAAAAFLFHVLRRSRWSLALVLPLLHSRWAVAGGYTPFATAIPLVVLCWGLTIKWLQGLETWAAVALATCMVTIHLWHGIAFVLAGFGFAVFWLVWRAPSLDARIQSVVPTLPAIALFVIWFSGNFGKHPAAPPAWMPPAEAIKSFVEYVWASVPNCKTQAAVLAAIVGTGAVASAFGPRTSRRPARGWRVPNPLLLLSGGLLAAYFLMPMYANGVEGIANRFAYPAVLAFLFGWKLPSAVLPRAAVLAAAGGLATFCLVDLSSRFRAFDEDTRGASALMDRIGPRETLYYGPTDRGVSKDFAPAHPVLRELQQFATVRHGGLPNSSFAGYGINYVKYVGGTNPMPGLRGPPRWSPEMTKFDYVLVRAGQAPQDARFRKVDGESGWELYAVCGSARMPTCS
ncbi:MAG: hypothetical protein ACRENE_07055, partial [Polyangiaceae bacterium]